MLQKSQCNACPENPLEDAEKCGIDWVMPTYVYTTLEEPYFEFEVKQSMHDEPLKVHPETGVPVRRVISGGYGFIQKGGGKPAAPQGGGGGCGHGCACHGH